MALPPSKKKKTTCREETTPPAWQKQQQLLPDELIEEIFMRLPARSVALCRCLSRSWAAVLSSRGFINRHVDLAAVLRLPLPTTTSRRQRFFFFVVGEAAAAWSACLREHHLAAERVTRSCRGLGLVKNYSTGVYYVCNPSTGQAATLPDATPVRLDGGGGYVSFGLGHDARADRHKVVRLYYHVGGGGVPASCEVYDVGAGSGGYWRPAASGARPPRFAVDGRFGVRNAAGVFAQGRVHWLATSRRPTLCADDDARRRRHQPDSLMSFSLADETFTCIPLPPGASACGRPLGLTVLHSGRLGLVSFYRHRPRDIWTPAAAPNDDHAWRAKNPSPEHLWSQLATVAGSGYSGDDDVYEESLEPVGRPYEDVLFASPTSPLHALSMALLRLPARALGRLKSVCRSWRAVIESDRFASAHNEHHRRLAHRVVLTVMPPPLMDSRVVVSKPCHGLAQVMMSRCPFFGDRTEVLNPVTRARRIFVMDDDVDDPSCSDMSSSGGGSIGLGYDESRQEHVLVFLAAGRECKVWRLRERSTTARTVPAPPITPRFLPPPPASAVPPVYVDGRIHWMCCSPRAILAFCVREGAFHVVPAPPPPGTPAGTDAGGGGGDDSTTSGGGSATEFLVELRGLLCVVQSCPSIETITIWSAARASAGGVGAWSREYVIELGRWPEFSPKSVELVVPMAIEPPMHGGRILLDTGSSLGYYDPVRRTLETVYSLYDSDHDYTKKKPPAAKRFFAAALWEESLVRPYDRGLRLWN